MTPLARAIVGARDVIRMPGAMATALVVVALPCAAALPRIAPGRLRLAGRVGAALVFPAGAAAAHAPPFQALTPEQPICRLDQRIHGPFCLGSQPDTQSSKSET